MSRWVLHVDMDAFFASVEQVLNPELVGKPVIVAGSVEDRGVVSAASYEARRFGVRSAMPTAQARRLCPQGVFVSGHHEIYEEFSRRVLAVLKRYTPLVEQTSIDEAYLDVTGCERLRAGVSPGDVEAAGRGASPSAADAGKAAGRGASPSAADAGKAAARGAAWAAALAREIKAAVRGETGLSCSVGVAPNRLLAKMASGMNKPDGLTVLASEDVPRLLWPKPVGFLHGVGPSTAAQLRLRGVLTIGDLARYPPDLLLRDFGVYGRYLHEAAHGRDETPVLPAGEAEEAKSLSRETTFAQDVSDLGELERTLLELADQVARRLRRHGYRGRTVVVKIRTADFATFTRSRTLPAATDLAEDVYAEARLALAGFWRRGLRVRLLGVGVTNLESGRAASAQLFDPSAKLRRVSEAADRIRDRFGEGALTRARLLQRRAPKTSNRSAASDQPRAGSQPETNDRPKTSSGEEPDA